MAVRLASPEVRRGATSAAGAARRDDGLDAGGVPPGPRGATDRVVHERGAPRSKTHQYASRRWSLDRDGSIPRRRRSVRREKR